MVRVLSDRMCQKTTRRSFLASLASLAAFQRSTSTMSMQKPFDLGQGIEVRDYRLFPTPDILRFIVEVHNTTDFPVDAPTVGVILPHLVEHENYGWASPMSPVIHPHTSGGLIGVAPAALTHDNEWGSPEWELCAAMSTIQSERLLIWDLDLSYELVVYYSHHLQIKARITNLGDKPTRGLYMSALLWDPDARICGITYDRLLPVIAPGETLQDSIDVSQGEFYDYIANPFALVNSVEGMNATLTLQPVTSYPAPVCEPIMPWNR